MIPTIPKHARFQAALRQMPRLQRRRKIRKPGYEPPVNLRVGQYYPSRLGDHYHSTLADDLMYIQYDHLPVNYKPGNISKLGAKDMENPYAVNRPTPRPKGNRQPLPRETKTYSPETIISLQKIQIHVISKDALGSKITLLNPMFQLRSLSGMNKAGGGWETTKGVEVVHAKANIPTWRIRSGFPMGVKVDLTGPQMWTFLGTFVEFVLPRIREFPGLVMPAPSANTRSPSMYSGVVSCGFKADALELFPQIEVNQDLFTKLQGFYVHFVTDAKGRDAQHKARGLMSGFQIPFIRK